MPAIYFRAGFADPSGKELYAPVASGSVSPLWFSRSPRPLRLRFRRAVFENRRQSGCAEGEEPLRLHGGPAVPGRRPVPRRPRDRRRRRPARPVHVLHGGDRRRRLEDGRRGRALGAGLRQGLPDGFDRRDRRLRVRSERDLRRHRRGADPRKRLARRRRVQVDRRRPHLEERRPEGHAADRARSRPSRRTRTSSTSRRRATSGARTPSAASSGPRTAAARGRRSSTSTTRRARRTSRWTPPTRASSTPGSGRSCASPWELVSGGPGSSLWKSTDGGDTWKKLTEGLPEGLWGKVGVAVSPARPGRVFAFVEAAHGGLFRSEDYGAKFTHVNDEHKIRERAWYYSLDLPGHEERRHRLPAERPDAQVDGRRPPLLGHVRPARRQPRPVDRPGRLGSHDPRQRRRRDDHEQRRPELVDPVQPADRAVLPRHDGPPVPVLALRLPAGQLERRASRAACPGARSAAPSGIRRAAARADGWRSTRRTPTSCTRASTAAQITRYDHRTRQARNVMAWPQLADGHATSDLKYRFQWNAPIMISPNDPKVLYHASQILMRSRDGGETWEEASPGPDAQRQVQAGQVRRPDHDRRHRGRALQHDLRARRVAGREGRDLGGLRRRARPRHARRRQDLAERDAAGDAGVDPDQRHRRLAEGEGRRVRRGDDVQVGRLPALPLQDEATTARPGRKIVAGIPADAFTRVVREDTVRDGPPLRRHRDGPLRLLRRRRVLAAVPAQPPAHVPSPTSRSRTTTSWSRRRAARSGSSTT